MVYSDTPLFFFWKVEQVGVFVRLTRGEGRRSRKKVMRPFNLLADSTVYSLQLLRVGQGGVCEPDKR